MNITQRRVHAAAGLAVLLLCLAAPAPVRAQEEDSAARPAAQKREEVSLEVHLYLLAATADAAAARGQLPESLSGVVRQLRGTLPAASYRVAMTIIHRVRDGGTANFRGVGAPLLTPPVGAHPPATFGYSFNNVRFTTDAAGGNFIHMRVFNFSARVPYQVNTARSDTGATAPVFAFEDSGLNTELSVREGEPTVIATVATTRPDDFYVLVINVRRVGQR